MRHGGFEARVTKQTELSFRPAQLLEAQGARDLTTSAWRQILTKRGQAVCNL
jgi:hypothetical protein